MKYFKFIGDSKHVPFKEGKIYKGSFEAEGWAKVSRLAKVNPCDWDRVKNPKKTLSEKIEKLKKQAEKQVLKCEVVLSNPTFSAINTKDEWDFIELTEDGANFKKGQIFKVLDSHFSQFLGYGTSYKIIQTKEHGIWVNHLMIKPSTEQSYVEQLKKEAFDRFGEIKEGDRFDRSSMNFDIPQGIDKIYGEINSYQYNKEKDMLFVGDLCLYKQGKWATRVKERVEGSYVKYHILWPNDDGATLGYSFSGFADKHGSLPIEKLDDAGKFLASQLEAYLNR